LDVCQELLTLEVSELPVSRSEGMHLDAHRKSAASRGLNWWCQHTLGPGGAGPWITHTNTDTHMCTKTALVYDIRLSDSWTECKSLATMKFTALKGFNDLEHNENIL